MTAHTAEDSSFFPFLAHGEEGGGTQIRRGRLCVGESITTSPGLALPGAVRLRDSTWRANSSAIKLLRLAVVRNPGGDTLPVLWPLLEPRADEMASAWRNVSRSTSPGSSDPTMAERSPAVAALNLEDGGAVAATRGSRERRGRGEAQPW